MAKQTSPHDLDHDLSVDGFTVSKDAYLAVHKDASYTLIATSALVLDPRGPGSSLRILLLQRAASDSNPNKWEPPGGAVDDEDVSILHAVTRELKEETGLKATRIDGLVGEPHLFNRSNGDTVCRFNFAVIVDAGEDVKLDPNEHQNYVWASEDEVRTGRTGGVELSFVRDEVKQTVLFAFP